MTETTERDSNLLDPVRDARYIKVQADRYEQVLADRVARLRRLADEIEREGRAAPDALNNDGQLDYLYAAQRALHSLHWGIANADFGGLLSAAADAHSAVRHRIK